MKEIHHRVKNNLQVISSLLDLQSLTFGDKLAAEAIKESRNRVHTMALIHQHLYQEGNMKRIEMEDYINNLAQSLFSSYNVKKNKISLHTSIAPVPLDVDLVILIGLVLNELISNALGNPVLQQITATNRNRKNPSFFQCRRNVPARL